MDQCLRFFRPYEKCFLLALELRRGGTHFQSEKEGEVVGEKLRAFLLAKRIKLIDNSSVRKNREEVGFYSYWGGVVYIHFSVGSEDMRIVLLGALAAFASENGFQMEPAGGNIAIVFSLTQC
ncbi:MAG: hypothetical protein PHT51_02160 [Patescibacteria group bacterium]|nr:hypothetical protein [Patescibacteria group bacterium]MDD4611313.1 hypothetical protein [Patescibacteria group bacterium]